MIKKLLFLPFLLTFSLSQAQFTNGGFEDWTNAGTYDEPTGYVSLNGLSFLGLPVTTFQSTDAHGGTYSCENQCVAYNFLGTDDTLCGLVIGSFAYTDTPINVEGWYQLVSSTVDHDVYLGVTLTKWNSGTNSSDTIAAGLYGSSTPTGATWTYFNLPLQYAIIDTPDSMFVVFGVGGNASSLMRLDDLSFNGQVGVKEGAETLKGKVFPVPAQDRITVSTSFPGEFSARILNMNGSVLKETTFNGQSMEWNTTDLPTGIYLLEVSDLIGESKWMDRIAIQR